MGIVQRGTNKKGSGGVFRSARTKRRFEKANHPVLTKVTEKKLKSVRVPGGNRKLKLIACNVINVIDPKTKKAFKANIKMVVDNPANRNFVKRNIMTKGTVVETDKGKVRITSRPGQEGSLNGVLV